MLPIKWLQKLHHLIFLTCSTIYRPIWGIPCYCNFPAAFSCASSISPFSHSHLRSTYWGSCYSRWLTAKWLKRFQKLEQERQGEARDEGGKVTGVSGGNPLRWSQKSQHTPLLAGIQQLRHQIEREKAIETETRGVERVLGMRGMR